MPERRQRSEPTLTIHKLRQSVWCSYLSSFDLSFCQTVDSNRSWLHFFRPSFYGAEDSLRRINNRQDVDGAKNQQPAMRIDGNEILEQNDDARSQRGADQAAATAERDHEKNLYRGRELEVHGADEAVVVGPQHSREATEPARNDKADVFMQPDMIAERSHARFALPDSHQGLSERGTHDHAQNPESDQKTCEREIIERDRERKRPWQAEIRSRDC